MSNQDNNDGQIDPAPSEENGVIGADTMLLSPILGGIASMLHKKGTCSYRRRMCWSNSTGHFNKR